MTLAFKELLDRLEASLLDPFAAPDDRASRESWIWEDILAAHDLLALLADLLAEWSKEDWIYCAQDLDEMKQVVKILKRDNNLWTSTMFSASGRRTWGCARCGRARAGIDVLACWIGEALRRVRAGALCDRRSAQKACKIFNDGGLRIHQPYTNSQKVLYNVFLEWVSGLVQVPLSQ
ncbi:hypothetical protein SELMODRAFT_427149 [Selaginella moellendorffii]|uniref:Uncharacterized protein n=1 Tax=Selaginella moellendorffii TaxID=88036 RepID=D8SYN5_SELML|nr:hypothetical protein SELMODRAFT_427149 [Selaginella moellendorffii]